MRTAFFNIVEDYETFLVNALSEKRLKLLAEQERGLLALKSSLEYRKTDLIYLVKQGFEHSKKHDEWDKVEEMNHGRFPGKYHFFVKFPDDYPESHPEVRAVPLFTVNRNRNNISKHLMDKNTGSLCISKKMHGDPDSYWKPNMNAKGAVMLARHLVTEELLTKKMKLPKGYKVKRSTISIKGTVIAEIKKVVDKQVFIKDFLEKHITYIDDSWTWGEIAFETARLDNNPKKEMMKYYQKKVKKNG